MLSGCGCSRDKTDRSISRHPGDNSLVNGPPLPGNWIGQLVIDFKMENGGILLQNPTGYLQFTPGVPSTARWLIPGDVEEWVELSVDMNESRSPVTLAAQYQRNETVITASHVDLDWGRWARFTLQDPGSSRSVTMTVHLWWISKEDEIRRLRLLLEAREREEEDDARRASAPGKK